MKKLNVLVMGLLLPMLAAAQTVKSPNGNVSVTFSLTEKGQPTYEMSYKGKTVCKPSHLGLELAKDKHASKGMEETSLMDGFTETGSKTSTFDETWKPVWGETATIRNHYNEMEVNLNQAASKRNITIRFRVYDYGMGLRYEFPQQESLNYFVAAGGAEEGYVADDHIVFCFEGCFPRRIDDDFAAGEALPCVVVGIPFQSEGEAPGDEGAEALSGRADEGEMDGVFRQSFFAVPS